MYKGALATACKFPEPTHCFLIETISESIAHGIKSGLGFDAWMQTDSIALVLFECFCDTEAVKSRHICSALHGKCQLSKWLVLAEFDS